VGGAVADDGLVLLIRLVPGRGDIHELSARERGQGLIEREVRIDIRTALYLIAASGGERANRQG
jgi:hypothetical protein